MMEVERIKPLRRGVPEEVRETTAAWFRVRYGKFNGRKCHTLAYIGFVPVSILTNEGYLWFHLTNEGRKAPPAVLRAARSVASRFLESLGHSVFVHTSSAKNRKFAEFLGFTPVLEQGQDTYFRRLP